MVPFARGYKVLFPIITVSGKLSQSFRFTYKGATGQVSILSALRL